MQFHEGLSKGGTIKYPENKDLSLVPTQDPRLDCT